MLSRRSKSTVPKRGAGSVPGDPTVAKLRVGIATSGRFHLLDLARELDAIGVDVSFYSYVPRKRAETFGLPGRCHVALLPFLFPLVAMERLFPRLFPRVVERLMCWALDLLVILRMRRCDVFICMSGMYLSSAICPMALWCASYSASREQAYFIPDGDIGPCSEAQQVTPFIVRENLKATR